MNIKTTRSSVCQRLGMGWVITVVDKTREEGRGQVIEGLQVT